MATRTIVAASPHCQHRNLVCRGKTLKGHHRYLCKDCRRTFAHAPLKGGPFQAFCEPVSESKLGPILAGVLTTRGAAAGVEALAAALSTALTPEQVMEVMAGRGVEGAGAGSVVIPTPDGEEPPGEAVGRLPVAISEGINLAALADQVAGAARDQKARFFQAGKPAFWEQNFAVSAADMAIIPLVAAAGKTVGVWVLRFGGDGSRFRFARKRELLGALAVEAARALERAFLFDAERARMRQESTDLLAEMQNSDQRLRLALQAGQMGTWELDLRTGDMASSEGADRLLGMPPGGTVTRVETLLERIHPDDLNEVLRSLEQSAAARGKSHETEFRVQLPGGNEGWLLLRGEVERDEAGDGIRLIGIVADISDRKHTEEAHRAAQQALRESEERLQAIIDNAPVIAYVKDTKGRYLLVNRAFEQVYGYVRTEVLGRADHDLSSTAFADAFCAHDQHLSNLSGPLTKEEQVRSHDGTLLTLLSVKFALRDCSGQPYAVCGLSLDISQSKEAEQARQVAEEERYWSMREAQGRAAELIAVMESMPDALLIGNEALVTLANRPALDLFGCETVAELNQDAPMLAERALVRDVSTGERLSSDQWPFRRALSGESRVQDLIVHHAKLGNDVVLHCTADPIRVSGISVGAVCVFTDLARSRQQTLIRNLIEAQEEERRAVAYELHDGLTQYIMAAHAHLESFSHLLPRVAQSEPALREFQQGIKYLDQAMIESRRLINGLRALALDDLGLAGALEQTLNEEKERAGWQEAEWTHNIAGQRYPKLLETAVYRVAQEALTNARKHAGTTRVRLLLIAGASETDEPVLSLEVRDWGVGFVPDETTTEDGHLGLQGMFERVNLVGGTYHLHSAPGQGTTVRAVFRAAALASGNSDLPRRNT